MQNGKSVYFAAKLHLGSWVSKILVWTWSKLSKIPIGLNQGLGHLVLESNSPPSIQCLRAPKDWKLMNVLLWSSAKNLTMSRYHNRCVTLALCRNAAFEDKKSSSLLKTKESQSTNRAQVFSLLRLVLYLDLVWTVWNYKKKKKTTFTMENQSQAQRFFVVYFVNVVWGLRNCFDVCFLTFLLKFVTRIFYIVWTITKCEKEKKRLEISTEYC